MPAVSGGAGMLHATLTPLCAAAHYRKVSLAISAAADCRLYFQLPRPDQCRLCRIDDEPRHWADSLYNWAGVPGCCSPATAFSKSRAI